MPTNSYHDFEMLLAEKASRNNLDTKAKKDHRHEISDVVGLSNLMATKCSMQHSHSMVDITGLQAQLQSFSPIQHTHTLDDFPDAKKQLIEMNLQIGILSQQLASLNMLIENTDQSWHK